MKRSRIYLLIVVSLALLFGWGIWRVYRAVKASMEPSVCACTVSPLASDQAAQALVQLVEQSILEKKVSLASAAQAVQQEFPYCTAISFRQQPSGLVQARIELDEPFCAVNDDRVVTSNGVLVLKHLYADDVVADLPQLHIENLSEKGSVQTSLAQTSLAQTSFSKTGLVQASISQKSLVQKGSSEIELLEKNSLVSPLLLSFLRHIPEHFFATHEVVYRSDDEIALVSREMPKNILSQEDAAKHALLQQDASKREMTKRAMAKNEVITALQPTYLCAVNTVVDHELLKRCEVVLADVEQQKMTSKKKARTALVLDLRFDKQIILYPYMGGQIHG